MNSNLSLSQAGEGFFRPTLVPNFEETGGVAGHTRSLPSVSHSVSSHCSRCIIDFFFVGHQSASSLLPAPLFATRTPVISSSSLLLFISHLLSCSHSFISATVRSIDCAFPSRDFRSFFPYLLFDSFCDFVTRTELCLMQGMWLFCQVFTTGDIITFRNWTLGCLSGTGVSHCFAKCKQ